MTPAELDDLIEFHVDGFGVLTATLANVHRNAETKPDPFVPSDFFPLTPRTAKPAEISDEVRGAILDDFFLQVTNRKNAI